MLFSNVSFGERWLIENFGSLSRAFWSQVDPDAAISFLMGLCPAGCPRNSSRSVGSVKLPGEADYGRTDSGARLLSRVRLRTKAGSNIRIDVGPP